MTDTIKSGKQILEDFFENVGTLEGVDNGISTALKNLYDQGKLSDVNIKNELQKLRDAHATN